MWPFEKNEEAAVAQVAVVETVEQKEAIKKEIQCPPFGTQVSGLTRFGGTWLNLNEVSVIEFNPPDGCGAECFLKGNNEEWHIPDADALAIRTYLEGFEQIRNQVDNAKSE